MLHREHSDFQWFKERTRALQSEPISRYSAMASVAPPLNAERSLPKDRADHDLPPKSYAEAVIVGGDDDQNAQAHERRLSMSGTSSTTAVEDRSQLDDDKLVYERHVGTNGRDTLTSVRPDESYESSLKHNSHTTPRERRKQSKQRPRSPLESGRKAGEGWQRSA